MDSKDRSCVQKVKHYAYLKEDMIGKGATGQVYQGINELTGEKVAIKILDMTNINNEVTQYLLACEKQALISISSPYVLAALDIVQQQKQCFMITAYCEGGTLKDQISKKGKLSQKQALEILAKLLKGYAAIKQKSFVHRDLKSSNIMLRSGNPVIIDFGYCEKLYGPKPKAFYNVGSPSYMSPEAYYKTSYSEKSDLWALGIILYQMMEGHTIDHSHNINRYFNDLIKNGFVVVKSPISNACQKLLNSILEVNPNKRPSTLQLLKSTQAILHNLSISNQSRPMQMGDKKISLRNTKVSFISPTNIPNSPSLYSSQPQILSKNHIEANPTFVSTSFASSKMPASMIQSCTINSLQPNINIKMSESIFRNERNSNQNRFQQHQQSYYAQTSNPPPFNRESADKHLKTSSSAFFEISLVNSRLHGTTSNSFISEQNNQVNEQLSTELSLDQMGRNVRMARSFHEQSQPFDLSKRPTQHSNSNHNSLRPQTVQPINMATERMNLSFHSSTHSNWRNPQTCQQNYYENHNNGKPVDFTSQKRAAQTNSVIFHKQFAPVVKSLTPVASDGHRKNRVIYFPQPQVSIRQLKSVEPGVPIHPQSFMKKKEPHLEWVVKNVPGQMNQVEWRRLPEADVQRTPIILQSAYRPQIHNSYQPATILQQQSPKAQYLVEHQYPQVPRHYKQTQKPASVIVQHRHV